MAVRREPGARVGAVERGENAGCAGRRERVRMERRPRARRLESQNPAMAGSGEGVVFVALRRMVTGFVTNCLRMDRKTVGGSKGSAFCAMLEGAYFCALESL